MPKSVFTDAYEALISGLVESRRSAGITQAELAALLSKPQSWVSKIERGERRIDLVEFCAIADALQIDRISLFSKISNAIALRPVV